MYSVDCTYRKRTLQVIQSCWEWLNISFMYGSLGTPLIWKSSLTSAVLFFCTDGLVDPARPLSSFSSQPWHSCHKLIYVRPNPKTGVPVGHWPIPESFWPDQNSPTLVSCNIRANHHFLLKLIWTGHTLLTPAEAFYVWTLFSKMSIQMFCQFLQKRFFDSSNQLTFNPVSTQEQCLSRTNLSWLGKSSFSL